MSIPTFSEMRQRLLPVWQKPDYARDILWAGIFGSLARNRAHEKSGVDILIVMKEHERSHEPLDIREDLEEACGREVSVMFVWQGPEWAWGHVRVEALLSSRTVYGNRCDVEHLRLDAVFYVNEGLKLIDRVSEPVENLKKSVAMVKTFEICGLLWMVFTVINIIQNFMDPLQAPIRETCRQDLQTIGRLLDIQPLHSPVRTVVVVTARDLAPHIQTLIMNSPDLNSEVDFDVFWEEVWDLIQPSSFCMSVLDLACVTDTRATLKHMLASKRLADCLEEERQVDDSMYKELIR